MFASELAALRACPGAAVPAVNLDALATFFHVGCLPAPLSIYADLQQLPPGHGVVPFQPYLQAIKDLDFDGAISLELEYAPDPSKIVEWVTEAYTSTDKLMAEVGLRG